MAKAMTLGKFLSDILAARNLTARALAEGAQVSQSGVSNIIQGKPREPDPRTLKALAAYLGIDVFVLFRLLGYVPPASELYGAYSPFALYIARRFEALSETRQRAFLHILETLVEEPAQQHTLQTLRESANPLVALLDIEDALPEIINQAANWYLSQGRFATPPEVDPQPEEEVLPGLRFGQLSPAARRRLLALLRHKVRQVFTPSMVDEELRK